MDNNAIGFRVSYHYTTQSSEKSPILLSVSSNNPKQEPSSELRSTEMEPYGRNLQKNKRLAQTPQPGGLVPSTP